MNINWNDYVKALNRLLHAGDEVPAQKQAIDAELDRRIRTADQELHNTVTQQQSLELSLQQLNEHAEQATLQLSVKEGPANAVTAPAPANIRQALTIASDFTRHLDEAVKCLVYARREVPAPLPLPPAPQRRSHWPFVIAMIAVFVVVLAVALLV